MQAPRDPLATLIDVHEISQLLYRYTIAIDTRELSLFDRCFVSDARIEIPGLGVLDRDGYGRVCAENLPAFDATQHLVGNPAIQVDGEAASSRCYFIAQHVRNALAPNPFLIMGGWYDDRLARVNGRWLITARTGTAVWFDGNPAVLGYPMPPGALPRSAGHACPPWLRGAGS